MITNEVQYRATKAHLERFEQAAANLAAQEGKPAKLRQLELDAVNAQADDLRAELADYEQLRSGQVSTFTAATLAELGHRAGQGARRPRMDATPARRRARGGRAADPTVRSQRVPLHQPRPAVRHRRRARRTGRTASRVQALRRVDPAVPPSQTPARRSAAPSPHRSKRPELPGAAVGDDVPTMYHANGKQRGDEQGAVGVAEVVQSDHGDAGAAGDPFEGLREGVRVDRSAFGVGEHPAGIVDADRVVFGSLEGPPAA